MIKLLDPIDNDVVDRPSKEAEYDDLLTAINTQCYMLDRAKKVSVYLERRSPVLARHLQLLEFFAQTMTSASAILALVGFAQWVAIPISVATLTHSIIEYYDLPQQVTVNNNSLRDVHNLMTWWNSLSMIDRRSRHAKAHAAGVLEGAILASVSASASSSVSNKNADNKQPSDEGEENAGTSS